MKEIKIDELVFLVDIEKTKRYYRSNHLCECENCQLLHREIKENYPELEKVLSLFGIDISKPDEAGSIDLEGEIQYSFVGFTVCGNILKKGDKEISIHDKDLLELAFEPGFQFPNEQKGDYFSITVYGVRLPCEIENPRKGMSLCSRIKDFIKDFLKRK